MSQTSPSASKTLLPAKAPEVNPWLQRKLQKPVPSIPKEENFPEVDSNQEAVGSQSFTNEKQALKENLLAKDSVNDADTADFMKPPPVQKIKPTAKEKWVPYDATIIVDTKENSNKKKSNNRNKKKTNKKKQQEGNGEVEADERSVDASEPHSNNGHKRKGEKKGKITDSKKHASKDNKEFIDDEPAADLANLNIQEEGNDKQQDSFSPADLQEQVIGDANHGADHSSSREDVEVNASAPQARSSSVLDDQRSGSRKNSKTFYNGGPKFRRPSSQMGIPMQPMQNPLYSPVVPNYMYQPLYQPYFSQPPGYPMGNYNDSRYGRRGSGRNNSSSSSINETTPSPSPPPNGLGYNKNSEPFFPQQQVAYYPFPTIPQQPIYPMIPPPSSHHVHPYLHEGSPVYANGSNSKRSSRSHEASRSASVHNDRELDVATQLDYYFSKENLIKDTYLRSNMKDGYVNLKVIANFARFKALTGGDLNLAIRSLARCSNIEYEIADDEYLLKSKFEYFFKK